MGFKINHEINHEFAVRDAVAATRDAAKAVVVASPRTRGHRRATGRWRLVDQHSVANTRVNTRRLETHWSRPRLPHQSAVVRTGAGSSLRPPR